MLASRGVVFAASRSISLRTFFKQFETSKPFTFRINRKSFSSTTTVINLKPSHFETLTPRQKEQINVYVDALLQWNQKMNLTAVREESDVMERHIDDSLAIIPPIRSSYLSNCRTSTENINLVDVGSGAGLPGLVLAIACPACNWSDWIIKCASCTRKSRGQNLGQNLDFREVFDVAVARAVAEMRILAEYCLPLVRVGGLFVAAKGHDPQDEVRRAERAINMMGASLLQTLPVESHSPHGQRTVVICLKDDHTPRKYPRDPGTPAKLPL